MTRKISRAAACLLLAAALLIAMIPATAESAHAASKAKKPTRVSLTVFRKGATTLKVKWDKSQYASGYKLYMKPSGGSYSQIATTKKRSYTVTGLTLGQGYSFRVRGYNSKRNGALSNTGYWKMAEAVTLQDEQLTPYKSDDFVLCNTRLIMGGDNYAPGAEIFGTENYYAYFNLHGKYSKMTFKIGYVDGDDADVTARIGFYSSDGQSSNNLIKTVPCESAALPKEYEVDLRGVNRLLIKPTTHAWGWVGLGDLKLYYAD